PRQPTKPSTLLQTMSAQTKQQSHLTRKSPHNDIPPTTRNRTKRRRALRLTRRPATQTTSPGRRQPARPPADPPAHDLTGAERTLLQGRRWRDHLRPREVHVGRQLQGVPA